MPPQKVEQLHLSSHGYQWRVVRVVYTAVYDYHFDPPRQTVAPILYEPHIEF
jgi:hypothetical protein